MAWKKYFLLTIITLLLTIFGSYKVNLKLRLLDSTVLAQTVNDHKVKADRLLEQGQKEFDKGGTYKALQYWKQSLTLYQEIGDRQGEAASMGNLGLVYSNFGNYLIAFDYHQKSLDITRRIEDRKGEAASLNNLGSTYAILGDYNKAIDYHRQSLAITREIKDTQGELISLGNLGFTYSISGNYNKAIYYQNAYQQKLLAFTRINSGAAEAITFQQQSQSGNGFQQQSQQASVSATSGTAKAVATSFQQQSQSGNGSQQQSQQASASATSGTATAVAFSSQQQSQGGNSSQKQSQQQYVVVAGVSTTVIAIAYQQQYQNLDRQQSLPIADKYNKAIDSYKKSLEFNKKAGDNLGQIASLIGLGNVYLKKGEYKNAIDYANQSLKLTQKIGDRHGEASSLLVIGNAHLKQKEYSNAIDSLQKSLDIYQNIGNPKGEATSHENLGNAYLNQGRYKTAIDSFQKSLNIYRKIGYRQGEASSLNYLGKALFLSHRFRYAKYHLRQAINIWEDIRKLLRNHDSWKVSIFEQQAQTYRLLQQVLVAEKQPLQALEISEQGRTRALVEILFRRINNKPSEEIIPPTPNLAEIQQIAQQQNATLVEYSVTPNEIYIWVIPPQGKIQFSAVPIPKDVSLQELVKISRNSIGVRGDNNNNSHSSTQEDNTENRLKTLHQLLIEPIESFLPKDEQQRVIFIPHQELFLVPFAALQNEDNKYLIEKHTILTAPSIQALSLTQKNKQTAKNKNVSVPVLPHGEEALIVGNPTMPQSGIGIDSQVLKQLEYAEREAKIIATNLGATAIVGDQATESLIVQKMASAKLIHLATHGLFDATNAIGSPGAIVLASDGKNDGFLTTSEIMEHFGLSTKQKLQADLVVLSACDTGRGDIRGEGVIGLSRAFMASGIPALVVSLWQVEDDETANLMTEFYKNIYERKFDKAKAMREAMLTMLNDDDGNPDPKAWAAFTVIGKAE